MLQFIVVGNGLDDFKEPDWITVSVDGFPVGVFFDLGLHGTVALPMCHGEGFAWALLECICPVLPLLELNGAL